MASDRQVLSDFYRSLGDRIERGTISNVELEAATDAFFEIQVREKCHNAGHKEMVKALFMGFWIQSLTGSSSMQSTSSEHGS